MQFCPQLNSDTSRQDAQHGNWVGGDDTEREAAWADYYKEVGGEEAGAKDAPAEAPAATAPEAEVVDNAGDQPA